MLEIKNTRSVLVVSENASFYQSLLTVLPPGDFELFNVSSCGEARRFIQSRQADIVILKMPLPDEHGLLFAEDFIETTMGIMLICSPDIYDSIAGEAEQNGIVVLSDPCPPAFVYVAAKMLVSQIARLERLQKKNKTLEEKMADIRIVNRAKWALIEKKNMSEADAHKYLEKMAMDRGMTKGDVAEMILEMLEN